MVAAHALNNKCFDLPFPLNTEPRINKFASALVVSVPYAALNRISDLLGMIAHVLLFVACCLKSTPCCFPRRPNSSSDILRALDTSNACSDPAFVL